MTKTKTYAISYFLGRTFFIGFGFSLLFRLLDKDTWIAAILGSILGFGILLFFERIKEKHALASSLQKILFFVYNFFVFSQILFIFETFCSSFYLIKSPIFYILLPVPFVIYKITKNGFSTIAKVTEVLFPLSFLLYLLVVFGLFKNLNLEYFQPVLMADSKNLFLGTIYFAIYSTAPFFLLWNVKTDKNLAKSYAFSMVGILIIAIFITGVSGPNLAQIYRFPEYMTLKKIKLFNFVEKVENIISVAWLFDLFITMAICGNNLKECLPTKYNKWTYLATLLLLFVVAWYSGTHYKDELLIYHALPIVLGIFMLLLFLFSLLHKKKESTT